MCDHCFWLDHEYKCLLPEGHVCPLTEPIEEKEGKVMYDRKVMYDPYTGEQTCKRCGQWFSSKNDEVYCEYCQEQNELDVDEYLERRASRG